jgi:isoquinoline 1-oxidoreductase alpha subunit
MYKFVINGISREIDADPETPLLWVIRDELGLKGTKYGCGIGQCGACTIKINGDSVRSCITTLEALENNSNIETIEAVAQTPIGQLLVTAWTQHQVPQCGYCQSGQIVAAEALLKTNPGEISLDLIKSNISNLCRCGTYEKIHNAVLDAAKAR